MMKTSLVIGIFLAITISSKAQPVQGGLDQFVRIERPGYSISCPKTWKIDTSHVLGIDLALLSKKEDSSDMFSENVNVMLQDLKGLGIGIDQFTQISEKQIAQFATDYEIRANERKETQGQPFHRIVYTMTQGKFKLHMEQYYFIKEETAYIVTLSLERSDASKFERLGELILKSFRLN